MNSEQSEIKRKNIRIGTQNFFYMPILMSLALDLMG